MKKNVIIVFCFYLISCGDSSTCDDRKPLFMVDIKGQIIEKSNDKIVMGGRPYEIFRIKNSNDSIYDMYWVAHKDYYDYVNVGDSVAKQDSSLIFKIFRNDSLITVIDFGFGCSYENNTGR